MGWIIGILLVVGAGVWLFGRGGGGSGLGGDIDTL